MIENSMTLNDIADMTREDRLLWNVNIEVINACNLNCKHYYIPQRTSYGIEKKRLFMLIDELQKLGTFNITLTGGELFLREDILELVKKIRKSGMKLTLFSNATLINEDIVKVLSEVDLSLFSTTIFSMDHMINDAITGCKGTLELILENLNLLTKYGIKVEVKTPILTDNYNSYEAVGEYCKSNGYRFFPSPNIVPRTDGNKEPIKYALSDDKFALIIRDIKEKADQNNEHIENFYQSDDIICKPLLNSLFIDSNGDAYPCLSWLYKVGNIYNSALSNIWLYSKELLFLTNLKKKDMENCKTCKLNDVCTICPGDSLMDGDMFGCSNLQKKCAMSIKNMM